MKAKKIFFWSALAVFGAVILTVAMISIAPRPASAQSSSCDSILQTCLSGCSSIPVQSGNQQGCIDGCNTAYNNCKNPPVPPACPLVNGTCTSFSVPVSCFEGLSDPYYNEHNACIAGEHNAPQLVVNGGTSANAPCVGVADKSFDPSVTVATAINLSWVEYDDFGAAGINNPLFNNQPLGFTLDFHALPKMPVANDGCGYVSDSAGDCTTESASPSHSCAGQGVLPPNDYSGVVGGSPTDINSPLGIVNSNGNLKFWVEGINAFEPNWSQCGGSGNPQYCAGTWGTGMASFNISEETCNNGYKLSADKTQCVSAAQANGTINVSSINAQTGNPVSASWRFLSYPSNSDPCSGHGGSCAGVSSASYTSLAMGNYQPAVNPASEPVNYSLRSVEYQNVALRDVGASKIFALLKNTLSSIQVANAAGLSVLITPSSVTLSAPSPTASVVISWQPAAQMSVLPGVVNLNQSGQVTIGNTGASGSQLSGITASVSGLSSSWLPASSVPVPSAPINAGSSSTVTISTPNGLAPGSYTAQVTFTGNSSPGLSSPSQTITVNYTVPAAPAPICDTGAPIVATGQTVTFTAASGSGTYSWSAPGGSSTSGSGTNFSTSYSAVGDPTVTVTDSNGQKGFCSVSVATPPVVPNKPTASFEISKDGGASYSHNVAAVTGDNLTYQWSSTNGASYSSALVITPGGVDGCNNKNGGFIANSAGATNGPYSVIGCQVGSTYTITYNVTGPGGSASDSATITVSAPKPTVSLTASPSAIALGQSASLLWTTTGATACTASAAPVEGDWSGAEPTGVNQQAVITPPALGTYTYTLNCTGPGGSASDNAKIIVSANTHLECVNNACASVAGAGPNRCGTNNDCKGQTHAACDANQKACVNVVGAGTNGCSTDPTCGGTPNSHLVCQGNSCLVVSGSGTDQCATPGLTCGSGPQLSVALLASPSSGNAPLASTLTATASNGVGTYNYTFWKDCSYAGTSVAAATTACGTPTKKDDGIAATTDTANVTYQAGSFNPLVIVENGASAVTGTVAVTATTPGGGNYLDCVNNACKSVSGSGSNHCATDADCGGGGGGRQTHAVCDVVHQACVNVSGAGASTCSSDVTCGGGGTHLACEGNSCLIVSGGGITDQCAIPGLTCVPGGCSIGTTQGCTSASNTCGMKNSGSEVCNAAGAWGACSATPPPDSACPVPVITSFTPSPATTIVPPEKVKLSWTSSNTDPNGCRIVTSQGVSIGSGLPANSSVTVSPTATTTYVLTCTGPGGSGSKSITIPVGGPGQIEIPPS